MDNELVKNQASVSVELPSESPTRTARWCILKKDSERKTLLLAGRGQALNALILHCPPLLLSVLLSWVKMIYDDGLSPFSNTFSLSLYVWMGLWGMYVLYEGMFGIHNHLYVLDFEKKQLLHLNAEELSPLTLDESVESEPLAEAMRLLGREKGEDIDWPQWSELALYQTSDLFTWYKDLWNGLFADRFSFFVLLSVVEIFLFPVALDGLGYFVLAHLIVLVACLLWSLAVYWLQRQLPARAQAVYEEFLLTKNKVRQEA